MTESAFASDFGWKPGHFPAMVYFHDAQWLRVGPVFFHDELTGVEYQDSRNSEKKLMIFND